MTTNELRVKEVIIELIYILYGIFDSVGGTRTQKKLLDLRNKMEEWEKPEQEEK